MKSILLSFLFFVSLQSHSQYIGVRARYTDTRLVDNSPERPSRENRLILSFYEVTIIGSQYVWTPTTLTNHDIWIYEEGLQYGNLMGGVLDSLGNNYPGYAFTAPRVVSYWNSLGVNYFDCGTNNSTHYVANGHELDCGFIRVSHWETDINTGTEGEYFTAPNVNLPMVDIMSPYYYNPGNINFSCGDLCPGGVYNFYTFICGSTQQLVIRALLNYDTSAIIIALPVRFANVQGELHGSNADIGFSNMTESDASAYAIEKSVDGINFITVGTVLPVRNDGGRADYNFQTLQVEESCYYRIKATENSGNSFYSNIFVLRKQAGSTIPQETLRVLTVYPNPVAGSEISFRLTNAEKGRYVSSIIAPDGKEVKQKMIEHDGGDLIRQLYVSGLIPGLYRLVIRSANYKYTQTFIYGN